MWIPYHLDVCFDHPGDEQQLSRVDAAFFFPPLQFNLILNKGEILQMQDVRLNILLWSEIMEMSSVVRRIRFIQ